MGSASSSGVITVQLRDPPSGSESRSTKQNMDAVEIDTSEAPPQQSEDICRVCLLGSSGMRDLFQDSMDASLSAKAMSFANVKMLAGDGLPAQLCYVCADKLESAYEFKLQVEQADGVLRERFLGELSDGADYESATAVPPPGQSEDDKSLLKHDQLLLQDEQPVEIQQNPEEGSSQGITQEISESIAEVLQEGLAEKDTPSDIEAAVDPKAYRDESIIRSRADAIPADEHDYILQQPDPTAEFCTDEERTEEIAPIEPAEHSENATLSADQREEPSRIKNETTEQQSETRRSKRKLARRAAERNSDEENYFENLNLSSRLKRAQQADRAVFFMCYLCDKQFLSKNVLKEHMHSHEEVRRALCLKKTPEKPQKVPQKVIISGSVVKTPPSGKKANKCPYCGKEYLYIISFDKHIKKHEREEKEGGDSSMPLEVSFVEDDRGMILDNSDSKYRRRTRRNTVADGKYNDDYDEEEEEVEEEEEDDGSGGGAGDDDDDDDKNERAKLNEAKLACDKCPQMFGTKLGLKKHVSVRHTAQKCNVCEEECDNLLQLRKHRAKHMNLDIVQKESKNEDEEEEGGEEEAGKEYKCPKCSAMYVFKKSLLKHMETHYGTNNHSYSCKVCGQQFPRKDQMRRHAEQHGRVKAYKCTQCNKTFGNEFTLRNHLISTSHKTFLHGQEYDPNKRIKRVAAKAAQKIIDKIKTEVDLESLDDDDNDDGEYYAMLGKRKRGPPKKCKKELECGTCHKQYSTKHSLMKHMEHHVKNEKQKKEKTAAEKAIKADGGDDDDNSDFESGLDWPMDSHECVTCKKRYSTKKSLQRHQLLHEEPNFECDICHVKFYRKDKLKAHYDKCSEKNPDQVRKCNICGDQFENNEILRVHRATHVTEGILTEEDLMDLDPMPAEEKKERVARKRRTDIVGLECTECNKQYSSRKGLLRHIQVHEGKKFLCDICPKKFYRREHLKLHQAKHNMVKPYKCHRCSKRFIKEEQLINHLSKHDRMFKKNKESDTTKRFLCEICSKSFTQSTTLIAHLRAHNGIKPYVCEVCSRPFTTNAYLKMHMRTHTQERPYICQYCSRAFARADTLSNHLTSHTGEAKYHCKLCPRNFRRLKSLKEHTFIHTGQRPYECPTCDRKFNNNGSRYAHSKRCKQNLLMSQHRAAQQQEQQQQQEQEQQQQEQQQQQQQILQTAQPVQVQVHPQLQQTRMTTLSQAQVVKAQNIKTIAIARQPVVDTTMVGTHQMVQHQEILMPLILPLTVTLADVGEEVILPEGTKIFTTT
ncbi:PREDICTED: zinc finger protein 91-like isoform X2 [Dinoponera quadriceps]|uniref:Zinc finger protein 91-like isoform X2 n=1 Tax=Dinoponera quadriceps TaxID=609295 RepID=A0A6P3X1P3_DINQU|nr:PREDICTED: zinc finger protein 91-like isoform X2 [Dinoponera quadriceps]